MERMSSTERNLLVSLINENIDVLGNKMTDSITAANKLQCWMKIEKEFNSHEYVNKRSWRQLRKAWDNMKTKERRLQNQRIRGKKARGGGPCTSSTSDPNPEFRIASPALSDTVDSLSIISSSDVSPVPSKSIKLEECVAMEELLSPSSAEEQSITDNIPCADTALDGAPRTTTSKIRSAPKTEGSAIKSKVEAILESLKSRRETRDQIQALRLKTAKRQYARAEDSLKHLDLQKQVMVLQIKHLEEEREHKRTLEALQERIMLLQLKGQEQEGVHKRRMQDLEFEMKQEQLRQLKEK